MHLVGHVVSLILIKKTRCPTFPAFQTVLTRLICSSNIKNTNPSHGLVSSQISPYIERVLAYPRNWMIHSLALLIRSRLEATKSRTVERSVFQIQALVDQYPLEETTKGLLKPAAAERLEWFHCLLYPSTWELSRELAEKWISVGMIKSALEIFERLQLWEEIIHCHLMLEKPALAEKVVVDQLDRIDMGEISPKDKPKFLCLLGDIRQQPSYYHEAWDLSVSQKRRYARAMRSLGAHYFKAQDFHKSVECYTNALNVNPLFDNTWFALGCASLRCEDYENAIEAFLRVTQLDYENSEAWCNLSSTFIKIGREEDAFRALKHSIKHSYDNHRIWQNYLYVSFSVGKFSETIRAMTRIMDLQLYKVENKEDVVDFDVLTIMVDIATTNTDVRPILESFLAHANKTISSPKLLQVTARYFASQYRPTEALEYTEKLFRFLLNHHNVINDEVMFKDLVSATMELCDAYDKDEGSDGKFKAKMAVRSAISRTKVRFIHPHAPTHSLNDSTHKKSNDTSCIYYSPHLNSPTHSPSSSKNSRALNLTQRLECI